MAILPFPQEILDWYTNTFKESDRLTGGLGLLEQARMHELILRHLPPPPAVVYDLGGGTGVHSFWLAGLGYTVHLVDIVPLHIQQARLAAEDPELPRLASLRVGDARQLDFEDKSADAVLLFGPLYHLTDRAERLKALAEATARPASGRGIDGICDQPLCFDDVWLVPRAGMGGRLSANDRDGTGQRAAP